MRRSSDRAQFEVLAALVAVFAVGAGLTVYADTLSGAVPVEPERETAALTLDQIHDELRVAGVVEPAKIDHARTEIPDGWQANITIRTRDRVWHDGPDPPADAQDADRRVGVRVGPGTVDPARLRVVIWQ